ncbi:MAG: SMC-Scp complex subunit ScpB [Gammaproteobacteria bacterium]
MPLRGHYSAPMLKDDQIKNIIEAALVAAGKPLSIAQLEALFMDTEQPGAKRLRKAIDRLERDYSGRGIAITEVASGFRIQTAPDVAPWVSRLWEERPPRYSRALLETLALIAYRQPITRGEIEEVRGVAVSTNITRTLLDRGWIRVVGHRDVPGRPAMYGTTREFLDYFGLKSLDELPTLAELRDIDSLNKELDLRFPDGAGGGTGMQPDDDQLDLLAGPDTDRLQTDDPGAEDPGADDPGAADPSADDPRVADDGVAAAEAGLESTGAEAIAAGAAVNDGPEPDTQTGQDPERSS